MGISIMGIATKADLDFVVRALEATLLKERKYFTLKLESEISFDNIILRKGENDIIDMYSSPSGTLVTFSYSVYEKLEKWHLSSFFDFNYFDISETSMEHRFAFFSGGVEKVGMNVYDYGSTKTIFGDNFLQIEQQEDIFHFVFPRIVNEYLPEPFHQMDYDKYKIKRFILEAIPQEINTLNIISEPIKRKKNFWEKIFWRS
jgi:hypothetical protein